MVLIAESHIADSSYGSVLQAPVALKLTNDGILVDNIVLIGSPIFDNSELYQQLNKNKNTKNVIQIVIPNDNFSNPNILWMS